MSYTLTLMVNFGTSAQNFTVAVESYSFSVNVAVSIGSGGTGAGAGKPSFSTLTINKMLDANTIALFSAAVNGRTIPTVTLALTKAGSTTPDTTYALTNAVITEVSDGGNSHGGPFPTEQVSFAFQTIKITSVVSGAGGGGGGTFTYDVTTNKGG